MRSGVLNGVYISRIKKIAPETNDPETYNAFTERDTGMALTPMTNGALT
jgi:hypothetical protein